MSHLARTLFCHSGERGKREPGIQTEIPCLHLDSGSGMTDGGEA
jgi:hypothetical protein